MGTRHLIAVQHEGQYKIAQYGQWDGYPEGQGFSVLKFLAVKGNIKRLRAALAKVRFFEPEGRDKEFIDSYSANAPEWSDQPDLRTEEQKRWFDTYITRDLGADILENVAASNDEEIILRNSIDFAEDSSCEYAYVIDLDKNTFEAFEGGNQEALDPSERFALRQKSQVERDYMPVRLVKSWPLDALPSEADLVQAFAIEEEEEESESEAPPQLLKAPE